MNDPNRGTGRTSRLIRGAPLGALLVCPDGAMTLFRNMCDNLGRSDLRIRRISSYNAGNLRGVDRHMIVFDHSVDPANAPAATPATLPRPAWIDELTAALAEYNKLMDEQTRVACAISTSRVRVMDADDARDNWVASLTGAPVYV